MNIVILTWMDYSGSMYNLASAVNRYTKHRATVVKLKVNPQLQYPTMHLHTPQTAENIRRMVYGSDAVVFFEYARLPKSYGLDLGRLRDKKVAVIFSGGGWRTKKERIENFNVYGGISRKVKWLSVSTDFLSFGDERHLLKWVPSNVRTDELREKYDYSKLEPPLICTAPSRSTDVLCSIRKHFKAILEGLGKKGFVNGLHYQKSVIYGVDNHTCLTRKARASIFFDRIYSIYGYNSQESGSFESAIVTGTSNFVLEYISKELKTKCPFIIVRSPREAVERVAELLGDLEYLKKKGRQCYSFVKKVHSGKLSAERFIRFLEE